MPYNVKVRTYHFNPLWLRKILIPQPRLEARVKPEIKALWQKAAELEGRTLTDFVIASLQEAAFKAIARHEQLKLDRDDSEAFVEALLNPLQPNEALKAAALRYQATMQS